MKHVDWVVRTGHVAVTIGLMIFVFSGSAHAGNYGSLAAGISGDQVGVGYATNYSTQDGADTRALEECSARSKNCHVVSRFWNGGCGYITTATQNGTCYGYGSTPAIARSECESRGCSCNPPIGGCTSP